MKDLQQALSQLTDERLRAMRRGIEKESLRATPEGRLALTPHPPSLGSPLFHPQITTDFSESQIELITEPHQQPGACLDELRDIHRTVYRAIGDEMLWVSSMPCSLPVDENIPIARYGTSNIGRLKSVYRMGLSHRYGRRMQTISGLHYNWSMPGLDNAQAFAQIRNFRRQTFLLLYLFGATPAVCSTFLTDRPHELQRLSDTTFHGPYATSLRMGRLGYQSEAQASLAVSYNNLDGYAASLHEALTVPYPAYEKIGVQGMGGDYNQLDTTLLQIENEFYGAIRPKRSIERGERPLHALRTRGVQYIEVRCMDLDPFEALGITPLAMRFIDIFLLHCLLSPSADDSRADIAELGLNQRLTAHEGRRPGLHLRRNGQEIELRQWGREIVEACQPIAERLDALEATSGSGDIQARPDSKSRPTHRDALDHARALLDAPDRTPSARVLAELAGADNDFVRYTSQQSLAVKRQLGSDQLDSVQYNEAERVARQSIADQREADGREEEPFETFRLRYLDPAGL